MKKLIIIQTVAPDYRALFFESIKENLNDRFELFAGNESFETSILTKSKIYKKIRNHFFLKRKFLFQTGIWHLLLSNNVLVLEMNPRILSNWIFLIMRKLTGKETVLWGHAWPRNGKNSKSDILRNMMRKLSTKIIVYTLQQKKELQSKMPDKQIFAAPNSVFKAEKMIASLQENPLNLIYVGRLVAEKKIFFLVKAFHKSINKIPKKAKLLIVGDGNEKNRIEQYIKENHLKDRVHLLGHISDYKKLKELYASSIFSISPGYVGLSVTQSFGFGVPMLISKNENHSPEIEAVIENENALLFKTNDFNNFTKHLEKIYSEKDKWVNKRKNIVQFCKKNYSVESMAEVFINLLEK